MNDQNQVNFEAAQELEIILENMHELLGQAEHALRGTTEESRAGCYWIAHIKMALDKNCHSYLGSSMCTMQDTITDLYDEDKY